MQRTLSPLLLSTAVALAVMLSLASSAQAGPTLSADLDLGALVDQESIGTEMGQQFPVVYLAGFLIRAGWRFDLGTVFLVPEIGGGYAVEPAPSLDGGPVCGGLPGGGESCATGLFRGLGGLRAGLSFPLGPTVRFEPAIYGHAGYALYLGGPASGLGGRGHGVANDIGLSLDLRLLTHLVLGAHLGYNVVTTWQSLSSEVQGIPGTASFADRWVGYGLHAGVLFW